MKKDGHLIWKNERRKLSELKIWPRNPRRIDTKQAKRLVESIDEFGQVETLAIGPKGEIYNGHQRLKVLMAEQGPDYEVDVRIASRALTEKEREKLVIYLHKGAAGEWDFDILAKEFELEELLDWGFAEKELAGLDFGEQPPEDPGAQIDRAEELREKWGVELGQLWEVGRHRIICGDCTDRAVVERLIQREKAALCVTSPPYGVGKSYETKGIGPWLELVRPAIARCCEIASIIIWNIGDLFATDSQFIEPTFAYSLSMFSEHGYKPIWISIWLKQGANYGIGPYHLASNKPVQQYEYLSAFVGNADLETYDFEDYEWIIALAGHKHKFVKRLSGEDRRDWGYSGVWKMNTVKANDDHPAMFPLELPERCIKMHSDIGGIVYEPFLGSGTTLVACERLGRIGCGVEISSAYVAVSLQRLADMGLERKLL